MDSAFSSLPRGGKKPHIYKSSNHHVSINTFSSTTYCPCLSFPHHTDNRSRKGSSTSKSSRGHLIQGLRSWKQKRGTFVSADSVPLRHSWQMLKHHQETFPNWLWLAVLILYAAPRNLNTHLNQGSSSTQGDIKHNPIDFKASNSMGYLLQQFICNRFAAAITFHCKYTTSVFRKILSLHFLSEGHQSFVPGFHKINKSTSIILAAFTDKCNKLQDAKLWNSIGIYFPFFFLLFLDKLYRVALLRHTHVL